MRTCSRCGLTKDDSEFNWRDQGKGYLQSVCRTCQQEQGKNKYENDKENVKEINRQARLRAIDEAQRYVYEYLSNARCEDCGEYDFAVLTFHHVRGVKKNNVANLAAQGYSIAAIQAEINKCIVLCHNCHTRREQEKSGGRFHRFWPKWPWEND